MKFLLAILLVFLGGISMAKAEDVKEPSYTVLLQDNNIEIRRYDPMIIASVNVEGSRSDAASAGFRKLADFIFGNNTASTEENSTKIAMTAPVIQEPSQKIAMTAPVIQENDNNTGQWIIRFVMPAQYTLDTLPKPNNPDVVIEETKPMERAVIKFSGFATEGNLQKHEDKLMSWLETQEHSIIGAPYYAFYDPPWTLPFNKRNEVMVAVKSAL